WVLAKRNRPIVTGDKLWSDSGSHAELQLGSAVIRLYDQTSINILNLDDNIAQLELDQGTLNLHIWEIAPSQSYEIDTPNLAFTVNGPGDYRIEVDPANQTTTVIVQAGQASAYGETSAYS